MNQESNKNVTIDDLAIMVGKGFDEVNKKLEKLDYLEQGQESILLKLDNVAYRFELVALQKRVEELEKRTGVNPATANI